MPASLPRTRTLLTTRRRWRNRVSVRRRASGRVHYNYFRDYDPAVGRYVESDPIGLFGGAPSTFTYTYDDPLGLIDPRGLQPPGGAIAFRDFFRDYFFGGRFPDKEIRSDGTPQGWGCGAKGNDWLVPDIYPNACRRHDVCYEDQCGKWTCDKQFLRDMKAEGTGGPFSRWAFFGAVGLFGGSAYQDAGASRPPLVSPPPQPPREHK